ncbi:hypothetical protein CQW23_26017 [Capsicum baccatum]|uniref:Glycosyl transferase family 28 C-terminal domain-containing protein n=1 Tax=Capsicum baccatum TaxID=33114 RepID=A0A2G2VMM4_CAPBA|nr:hypothetical protein CQW23_26017 [Capsicum baccatum]
MYWFAIPNIGSVLKGLLQRRKELMSFLNHRKYKEMAMSSLEKKKFRPSPLEMRFHLRDSLGSGHLKTVEAPTGLLVKGGSTKYHLRSRWLQVFSTERDRRDLQVSGVRKFSEIIVEAVCVKAVGRMHLFSNIVVRKWDGKVVLILGGSWGANAINVPILHLYSEMLNERNDLFLIWQNGVLAYDEMESLVKFHPRFYRIPFLHLMVLAYAAAGLIVSRAGVMICSEILVARTPCILFGGCLELRVCGSIIPFT